MARLIEEIILKVDVDSSGLDETVDKSTDSVDDLTKSVDDNKSSLGAWAAVAATAAGIAGIGLLVKTQAEAVVETDKYAKRLGIATQELMALQAAAGSFNIEAEDVNEGLKNMVERLGEASLEGQGATFDAIKRLGLDLKELESLSTEDKFIAISDALSKVESTAERTFLQMEIGQEEFFKLGEFMQTGAGDMRDLIKESKRLSGSLSDLDIENIRGMESAAAGLSTAFGSVFQEIAANVAPVMETLLDIASDLFVSFREEGMPLIQVWATDLTDSFLNFVNNILPAILTVGSAVFDSMVNIVIAFGDIVGTVFSTIGSGWALLGNEVAGERNWIDDITASISIAAKAWPELLQNAFLNIASSISSVLSAVEDKFFSVLFAVQTEALIAANAIGKISNEELEAGIIDIGEKEGQRDREGGFFDELKASQESLIAGNNEVIDSIASEIVSSQNGFKSAVGEAISNLKGSLSGLDKVALPDKIDGKIKPKRDDDKKKKEQQQKIKSPFEALELGSKKALDLLASRETPKEDDLLDVNKMQLEAADKAVIALEQIAKNKTNTINTGTLG